MSEQREFSAYTRDEFLEEFVHPDDRAVVEDALEGPRASGPAPAPFGALGHDHDGHR
jgi:hypothetical protein